MTLHLNFASSLGGRQAEQQQQHIREARKELKERVRTDWDYPTLPAHRSCGRRAAEGDADEITDRIAGFRFHHAHDPDSAEPAADALGLGFEPTEWRARYCSSGSESESSAVKPSPTTKAKSKAYKFDSPDSVGPQISERRMARKRKRQKALEEELTWNDGLAHWMRRRDLWSCARTESQVQKLTNPDTSPALPDASPEQDDSGPSSSQTSLSSPRTSTSTAPHQNTTTGAHSDHDSNSESYTTPPTSVSSPTTSSPPLLHTAPSSPTSATPTHAPFPSTSTTDDEVLLLPLAPPLLPNNPIRRRISANHYPEIYSKVILQSRAPSVPLNLATLMRALIQGWKDDGEWPPKNAVPEKAIGRKKGKGGNGGGGAGGAGAGGEGGGGTGSSLGRGVKAVGRVLRLTTGAGTGSGHGEKSPSSHLPGLHLHLHGKTEEGA